MATIKDIARNTGFSVSVVSRALNNKYGVKDKTRLLIENAAKELKYYPHAAARSLVTRKTETIGVMMADLSQPYYSQIIKGMEYSASQNGYMLLFSNSYESLEQRHVVQKLIESGRVDGLIIIGSNIKEKNFVLHLLEREIQFVLVERNFSDPRVNSIFVDNVEGAFRAVNYLIEKGHHRIAHISGNLDFQVALDRLEGYKKALQTAGLPFIEELITTGKFIWLDGYLAMKELLRYQPTCTAVFAANDTMAYGALQAINEAGLRVPADIAIIGFDDLEFSHLTSPPLTTIHQPRYEMGEQAVQILVDQLRATEHSGAKQCFIPELVIRKSA